MRVGELGSEKGKWDNSKGGFAPPPVLPGGLVAVTGIQL